MKKHQEVLNHLFKLLETVKPQPPELYERLAEIMQAEYLAYGGVLFAEGKVIDKAVYLSDGYVIGYCLNDDNEMQVVHFHGKGEIIAGVSFMEQIPSPYTLSALPGAYMLTLTFEEMEENYKLYPSTEELARLIISAREAHQVAFHRLLREGGMARVKYFYGRFPELLPSPGKLVKDADIASYLGISEKTLRYYRKRLRMESE